MEFTKNDTKILKGIAIMLMVVLHLFATKNIEGLFSSPVINGVPLTYYFGLMGDACRAIYMFVTGYAFYIMLTKSKESVLFKNLKRISKLYVNLWIVFVIFIPLGFIFRGFSDNITFDSFNMMKLFMNFIGIENSYNGAWWFLQTYIIFVLLSPMLIKIVQKTNFILLIMITGILYVGAHIQEVRQIVEFNNAAANYLINVVSLFVTSLLSFFVGSIFAKEKFYTKIHNKFHNIKFKNTLCLLGFGLLILLHTVIESSIIAPINAVVIIVLFTLLNKPKFILKPFDYISNHSTNIWLTHMFFYSTIFSDFVYIFDNPILVFLWLITLCVITSYIVKLVTDPVFKLIDNISVKNRNQQIKRKNILARD